MLVLVGYAGWQLQSSIQDWHGNLERAFKQDAQLLQDETQIESQLSDAIRRRDTESASFRALRDRVPARLVDSDILRELEKVVSACDCTLNDFRPISSQIIDTKDLKCRVRSFHLSMQGSYPGLFAFARALDDLPFLVQLKRLHLAAPSENRPISVIELEIGILYEPEWGTSELVSADSI